MACDFKNRLEMSSKVHTKFTCIGAAVAEVSMESGITHVDHNYLRMAARVFHTGID